MAIITMKITVRRTEGRGKVDPLDIAQSLAEAVEDLGEFEVLGFQGDELTYEVSTVQLVIEDARLEALGVEVVSKCRWCSGDLHQVAGGRHREFCDDKCRQADYRWRQGSKLGGLDPVIGSPPPGTPPEANKRSPSTT